MDEPEQECRKCLNTKPAKEFGWQYQKGARKRRLTCLMCSGHHWSVKGDDQRKQNAANNKAYKLRLWLETVAAYGGKCTCCGETEETFLQLDHVENDGAKHRAELYPDFPKSFCGNKVHVWAKQNGWPTILQLHCANCNFAKMRRGVCPHVNATA